MRSRSRVRNVAQGRVNKSVGDAFEAWCEIHYARALSMGILVHPMEHNQPASKMIGGKIIYTSSGLADRTGLLASDKTIAIEEKSTDKDCLPKRRVEPKQAAYLDAIGKKGHVAILLVEFRLGMPDRFAVPWLSAPWTVKRTAESIALKDLDPAWRISEAEHCFLARFCADRVDPVSVGKRVFPRE